MTPEANRLARIAKLTETWRELHAQAFDVQCEIMKLAKGQDAIGDVLKRLKAAFSAEFEQKSGSPYSWTAKSHAIDSGHLKRWLKWTTEDDIVARMMAYFHQSDEFTRRAGYTFGLFVSQFNALAVAVQAPARELSLTAPSDCQHTPRCADDESCTTRRLKEMRA